MNKMNKKFKDYLETVIKTEELPFIKDIISAGGEIFNVGGKVRDELLGRKSKDLDLLIRGISLNDLEIILKRYGTVNSVGQKFSVIKWKKFGSSEEIDIAVPRTEKKTGSKRTDFDVVSDPFLPIEDDLKRRDFTINSIAKKISGEYIDPYNGLLDIKNKVIRMISSDTFDPETGDELRMLRAVNFASRLGFDIESETFKAIQKNAKYIKQTSRERITEEFIKIVKGKFKAKAVNYLIKSNLFKEIFNRSVCYADLKEFKYVNTLSEFLFLLCLNNDMDSSELKNCISLENTVINEYNSLNKWYKEFNPLQKDADIRMLLFESIKFSDILFKTELKTVSGKNYINEFKNSFYPKKISELNINGNDLLDLGFKGKEIGKILSEILYKIYDNKLKNNFINIKEYILNENNKK